MDVLIFLVPAALGLGFLGLLAFLWSLNNNQLDDLDGAAWRVLMDDDVAPPHAEPPQAFSEGLNPPAPADIRPPRGSVAQVVRAADS